MSGKLVAEVLDYAPTDLRAVDRLVLIALAEDARDHDRVSRYRSAAEAIADRVCSTPGTVRNATSRLAARGLIEPVRGQARRGRVQHWRVAVLGPWHRAATWSNDTETVSPDDDANPSSTGVDEPVDN